MFSRVRTHVHRTEPLLRDTAPSPAPFSHSALHRIVIAPSRSHSSVSAPAPSTPCVCGCGCVYVCVYVRVTETRDLNASREPDTERCSKESQDGVTARPLARAPRVHRIVLIDPSIPRWGSSTARGAIAGEENTPLMLEARASVVQGSRARLRNPGLQIQHHVIEVEEIKLCRKEDGPPPRVGGERSGHQRLHAKRRRMHYPRISSNRLYPSIPQAAARRPHRARVDIMQMDERTHCRISMRRIPSVE
ncbi:hypothetical protein DFH09DRAFT_1199786 [Mycena vulgaris]|nr:hypothetical protein DFH09DRAFT_1199786 [Mycena vulgaris]